MRHHAQHVLVFNDHKCLSKFFLESESVDEMFVKKLLVHVVKELIPYPVCFDAACIKRILHVICGGDMPEIWIHRLKLRKNARQIGIDGALFDVCVELTITVGPAVKIG